MSSVKFLRMCRYEINGFCDKQSVAKVSSCLGAEKTYGRQKQLDGWVHSVVSKTEKNQYFYKN